MFSRLELSVVHGRSILPRRRDVSKSTTFSIVQRDGSDDDSTDLSEQEEEESSVLQSTKSQTPAPVESLPTVESKEPPESGHESPPCSSHSTSTSSSCISFHPSKTFIQSFKVRLAFISSYQASIPVPHIPLDAYQSQSSVDLDLESLVSIPSASSLATRAKSCYSVSSLHSKAKSFLHRVKSMPTLRVQRIKYN